jgi:outer membrane receptor protein involved in Fe transport
MKKTGPSQTAFLKQNDRSQWYGARLVQSLNLYLQRLYVGGEIESRGLVASSVIGQHLETEASVFGKDEIQLTSLAMVSGYARFDHYVGRSPLSYGTDIVLKPIADLEIFGGYSRSFRFPTFQEQYWRDTNVIPLHPDSPPERHHLWEAGIRVMSRDRASFEVTFFHRTIFDAIGMTPTHHDYPFPTFQYIFDPKVILQGSAAKARVRIGSFWVEGEVQYLEQTDQGRVQELLPRWSGSGGIYFWDKLVNNHLDLKAGLRGRFVGAYRGAEFNPQVLAFVPSSQQNLDLVGTSDAVIIAHLGSAYVHLVWENLLDRNYVVVPYYPMPDRTIRFGISWEFAD